MIPVYKPYLPPASLKYAHEALDSTWISSQGKFLPMVTEKLQELLGVPHVLLTNNGTAACHLVAKSLSRIYGVSSGKKKLLVPNNVYVAAWNSFLFDKEYTLIPVDACLDTWNVSIKQLSTTLESIPDADVLIVHNIGNIINVPDLQRKFPNTHFVEDNCEGFLGTYNGQLTGTASFASAISFFGNKNITSGEGGAFITQNEEAYNLARCVHGQGQSSKRFVHSELGYNYRMTNVQAAILCGQLDVLQEIADRKWLVFNTYKLAFDYRQDVRIQEIAPGTAPANWMFGIRIPGSLAYEQIETYFRAHGIEIRPMFYPIFDHDHLKNNPDVWGTDHSNAITLNKECFILPSYPELSPEDQKHIIHTVNEYLKILES
jgi:perosamine synthetase